MHIRLHPLHHEDLKNSGLIDDVILEAGIHSLRPQDIPKRTGLNSPGITSVYVIPYPNSKGFERFKLFWDESYTGKKPKYHQKKGSRNHLYIPSKITPSLRDTNTPLCLVEGEKKVLKGCQEGLCCIGLSGLWNWSDGNRELIPDFDLINFMNRVVYIIPDSDWTDPNKHGYQTNLAEAVNSLANRLTGRGAKVFIVELPKPGANTMHKKIGLDDFLMDHASDNLKQLPVTEVMVDMDISQNKDSRNNDKEIITPVPFPFEAFPSTFRDLLLTYSAALQIEPELVALMMMGVLSGAIGNTIRISVKEGWAIPPFLWIAIVKESGYGQSPAQHAILSPVKLLQAKDTDRYNAELKAYEEAFRKAQRNDSIQIPEKPRATQRIVSDVTTEALADIFEHDGRGVISDKDELSGLVCSFNQYKTRGGDDRQKWLSLFNCEPLKVDRRDRTRFIKNTGIAIIGGIQTRILPDVFNDRAFNDGLLPRFLIYRAQGKDLRFNRQGISDYARKAWQDLVTGCYQIPCNYDKSGFIKPVVHILDGKALDLWETFYNEATRITPFLSERAQVFIPKLTSYYSLKFAGILHVLRAIIDKRGMPSCIQENVAEGAVALTRFFMWQTANTLKLYDRNGQRLTEYEERLIKAIQGLRNEVKNGKLPLARIKTALNDALQPNLQLDPAKIARMIQGLGLRTDKSTGNLSYLIWEPVKMQKLFSRITVTTVTNITPSVPSGFEEVMAAEIGDTRKQM
jgi:hypothetical protein